MYMEDFDRKPTNSAKPAVYNGIPPPSFELPLPDKPEVITSNLLKLLELTPNPRLRLILQVLVKHLHEAITETNLTTDELSEGLAFLYRVGMRCTRSPESMSTVATLLGVKALVNAINNPVVGGATENAPLGPFYKDNAEDIELGESIASEGSGDYLYMEGRILTTKGSPIADAVVEAWEANAEGLYDVHYARQGDTDCRGRVRSGKDGKFGFRAVFPAPYPLTSDGPIGELLRVMGRHNMRPSHVHVVVKAPGYHTLATAFHPEGTEYLTTDVIFGVKKSLVVKLQKVEDEDEDCKRGTPKGSSFMLLQRDIVLRTEEQAKAVRAPAKD